MDATPVQPNILLDEAGSANVSGEPSRPTERPERWRDGVLARLPAVTGGHVAIIVVVLLVAVIAAATVAVRAQPTAGPEERAAESTTVSPAAHPARPPVADGPRAGSEGPNEADSSQVTADSAAAPGPTAEAEPEQVTVHVAGKVERPGVVQLSSGARVVDAIEAAGGTLPGVTLRSLNLARQVVDGEQVLVGYPPEDGAPPVPAGTSGGPADADETAAVDAPVELNTASDQQLQELPGVGPVLAQRLIEYRTEHGGFTAIDELLDISGIGERTFADLEGRVTVGPVAP